MPPRQSRQRPGWRTNREGTSRGPSRSFVPTPQTSPTPSNHTSRAPSSHGSKSIRQYREEAKIAFSGTIDGLRSGNYSCVSVLFVTWKGDDMNCLQEIEPLKQVFEKKFGFNIHFYQIPSERSMQSLNKRLSDFVMEAPSGSLTIFCYGGHGYRGEETGKLKFAAKGERFAKGDSSIFYQDILNSLKLLDGDLLLILDTCYAGGATYHHKLRRRIELLAATAHDRMAPGPERKGSFTPVLAKKLDLLLGSNPHGFLVSDLFIALDYDDSLRIKPRWYPQSETDCGLIFLCPRSQRPAESTEATLHLCLSIAEPPDARVLHDIANGLRFIPHIKKISVGDLNAPGETIRELKTMIDVADKFRWWAKRARERLRNGGTTPLERGETLALYDWAQGASFPEKGPAPAREKESMRKPEEPREIQTAMSLAPPTILLDGRDALSIYGASAIPGSSINHSNPYSPLADASDTTSIASSVHSNLFSLPIKANQETPPSSAGGDNTSSRARGLGLLLSEPAKKRRKNRRKGRRTVQVPGTFGAQIYSYRAHASVATILLLLLFSTSLALKRDGDVLTVAPLKDALTLNHIVTPTGGNLYSGRNNEKDLDRISDSTDREHSRHK